MNFSQAEAAFQEIMLGFPGYWCVAGGWAIDFFLGRQTREHHDLEVVVLRQEFAALHQHLRRFGPQKIFSGEPPRFVPWEGGEIEPEVIQIRLAPLADGTDFDLLLTPSVGGDWICRRDERLRLPLESVRGRSSSGLPFLKPEIVLLFKAKHLREQDAHDFTHAVPALSAEAGSWLCAQLHRLYPGHLWIAPLERGLGKAAFEREEAQR